MENKEEFLINYMKSFVKIKDIETRRITKTTIIFEFSVKLKGYNSPIFISSIISTRREKNNVLIINLMNLNDYTVYTARTLRKFQRVLDTCEYLINRCFKQIQKLETKKE